jgi:hypothetical protein
MNPPNRIRTREAAEHATQPYREICYRIPVFIGYIAGNFGNWIHRQQQARIALNLNTTCRRPMPARVTLNCPEPPGNPLKHYLASTPNLPSEPKAAPTRTLLVRNNLYEFVRALVLYTENIGWFAPNHTEACGLTHMQPRRKTASDDLNPVFTLTWIGHPEFATCFGKACAINKELPIPSPSQVFTRDMPHRNKCSCKRLPRYILNSAT